MNILNHRVRFSLRSKQPWSHMRLHRRSFTKHFVWGRISIVAEQPQFETVCVCAECNGLVEQVFAGDEGWGVCQDCGNVEGRTIDMTEEEYEAMRA